SRPPRTPRPREIPVCRPLHPLASAILYWHMVERALSRWQAAGLLDAQTVARITAWEAAHAGRSRFNWPVLIALALGSLAVGAGVLLFVAAHWDSLSPAARFAIVLTLVIGFHL